MVKSAKKSKQRPSKRPAPSKSRKSASRSAKSRGPTPKPVVIDVHAHVLVPEVMKATYDRSQYSRAMAASGGMPEPIFKRMTELPLRLNEMNATGVDNQHIETRRFQIEEICRDLGVFPQMVCHTDKTATFASSESFFQAHVIHDPDRGGGHSTATRPTVDPDL